MRKYCSNALVLTWTTHAGTDADLKSQKPIPDSIDTAMISLLQKTCIQLQRLIPVRGPSSEF